MTLYGCERYGWNVIIIEMPTKSTVTTTKKYPERVKAQIRCQSSMTRKHIPEMQRQSRVPLLPSLQWPWKVSMNVVRVRYRSLQQLGHLWKHRSGQRRRRSGKMLKSKATSIASVAYGRCSSLRYSIQPLQYLQYSSLSGCYISNMDEPA